MVDQVADLSPWKWQFEIPTDRFLLWEFTQIKWQIQWHLQITLHCTCRSTPNLLKWQFEIPTLTLRAKTDQVVDQVAPVEHLTLHLQIYPQPSKMAIWKSYWEIPTLRAQTDQVAPADHLASANHFTLHLQIYPTPINWQFEIPTDRFLLWELRQIMWQIYPPGAGILSLRGELNWVQLIWAQMASDHLAAADNLTLHLQIYPPKMAIWNSYW